MTSSRRGAFTVVLSALAMLLVASCANSGGTNQLGRTDGPAQVDPDFGGLADGTAVVVGDGSDESESGG